MNTTDTRDTEKKGDEKGLPASRQVVTLVLQQEDPLLPQSVFRLHKDRVVIGSIVSADIRLQGEGIAPIHAVLETAENGTEATIYDLASDTGVFVNNERVVTHRLKAGDRVRIGAQELAFTLEDPSKLPDSAKQKTSEGKALFYNPAEDLKPLLLQEDRDIYDIFDYTPSQARALQVTMSWRGTILACEHFVKEQTVTVGATPHSDFGIPPLLGAGRYDIVTRVGEDFVLNLDPQMRGVIQQKKGELRNFDDIRSEKGVQAAQIPVGGEDFAKVSIGDIDFYLCYTAAPPRLKSGRMIERDPLFLKIVSGSAVFTIVILSAIFRANVPQLVEPEQVPERIATILYQPEKYSAIRKPVLPKPEAKPEKTVQQEPQKPNPQVTAKLDIKPNPNAKKDVPKEMIVGQANSKANTGKAPQVAAGPGKQGEAKEGEGARAKGTEGTRGQPNAAKNSLHQDQAHRPSPEGGEGQGAGNSQILDEGNVDFLKGASGKIQNILGNSAAGLGKGGEKLKGFGGFTTQGSGGLALSGTGKGGGGNAETTLGGLGDKGKGGGKIGTGLGAAGSGTGFVGGQVRVAIRTGGPEEAVVMGAIDAEAVEAALLAHRDEFRLCYEKEINAENPALAGRVSTSFVIGSTGHVNQAGIESTTLKNSNTERCILNVIKRIEFPVPRGAGVVQVTYPFKFSPVGR